jgi:DNA-binding NtrC family response regulator
MGDMTDIPFGPGPLKGMRVLVVEDNGATAFLIEQMLLENGARLVGTCASVTAARSLLATERVDFALIDLRLADQFADGLIEETVARNLRFAVLTGLLAYPSNAQEHAVGVLRKPIDRHKLIQLLSAFA